MEFKKCFKCRSIKNVKEFYKHKMMKDGYLNKCIECARSDSIKNRNDNIEKVREYDRKRGIRQSKEYFKEYRKKFENKYKATNIVNNAIRDKKLFKEPCEICGDKKRIHAHHDDYAKPLNIRWLCAAHHKQWHVENGEGKNG